MTATTEAATRILTYREALNEALALELDRDPDVFLIGEDIGDYGGVFKVTQGLLARFGPERVRETPIAEAGFVGAAIGAAMMGKRPIAELMFMDFALVAADQLFNQAAKMRYLSADRLRVPLTIRTQQGVMGGGPQHSQSFEALFSHLPGFAVALPATPADAKGLLLEAIRRDDPAVVIEHRGLYATKGEVPYGDRAVAFGRAAIRRPGADVTIVSYSRGVQIALEAAHTLAEEGVECEVIDLRTLVPLDWDTVVSSVTKTGRLAVVHEAHRFMGPAAEIVCGVAERAFDVLEAQPQRICGLDMPVPYAATLERAWLPQPENVATAVRRMLEG
jgi:pyruvate/2-oxoglutarate/acetoin dehydrogenase E1 component